MKRICAAVLAMLILCMPAMAEGWSLVPVDVPYGEVISIAPDGETMLIDTGDDVPSVLRNGVLTAVTPDYMRSVEDTYGNFAKYLSLPYGDYRGDSAGVLWSPDSRYFTFTQWRRTMIQMQWFFDPVMYDAQTAQVFLFDTFASRAMEDHCGVFTQGCFDSTGRYFYYTVWGNITESHYALMRHDLQTGENEMLAELSNEILRPQLFALEDDVLVNTYGPYRSAESAGISLYENNGGVWSERHIHLPASREALLPQKLLARPGGRWVVLYTQLFSHAMADETREVTTNFAILRVDTKKNYEGFNELIYIESLDAESATSVDISGMSVDDLAQLDLVAIGSELQMNGTRIYNACMSPDGDSLLLLVVDLRHNPHFMIMDLETLELESVDCTFEGFSAFRLAGESDLAREFLPGFQWHKGNNVVMLTEDGVRLFKLQRN